ncbi:hypothetical protein [Pseudomonas agarici]|uniref:hypothetical protein n=1 Tax=Pseudomonas agarici TaxID=46677 RepID=UPI0012E34C87|nr:hypothetical protein [Pseudomonas agarici]
MKRPEGGFFGGPEILQAFSGALYGAAPRVESNLKILIILKFPKIKISSIPKATLYPLKLML